MEGHKGYMRRHQVRRGEVNVPSLKGEMSQVAHTGNVVVSYVLTSSHQSVQSRHRYSMTHNLVIHIIFGSRCRMKVKLLPCLIKIMLRKLGG